ncbi:hypothetical protein B0T22DRAFT_163544 [Podospora appendiculata]|uniref:LYR motif-containing protein Cup1-like N-terminal domain-containing protein n=1 Tax=Podospora appendiculata TaxID=314037 RepID=A0AAE0XA47_9PEZI|nr:hypothetical protein B0T22DRAFT_163544 [Podospora appendiculata]
MSHPLQLPHPKTTLHLFRHLLRESSYLPPIARSFIDGRITARFRSHARDDFTTIGPKVREAHRGLRNLRAANAGDMERMRRVLYWSFGRLGRRRRELLGEFVRLEHPNPPPNDRRADFLDTWDVKKVTAFVRSQAATPILNSAKTPLTIHQVNVENSLPTENAWGRPLAAKLRRSKLRKAWKLAIDKVIPPLPGREWTLLRDLANGTAPRKLWAVPKRRPVCRALTDDDLPAWNWQTYATQPVAKVDVQANRRNKLLSGIVDEHSPVDPPALNCHRYTPRFWRRMYHNIYQMSAKMEPSRKGVGWDITWGAQLFEVPPAPAASMDFFQGARADGTLLSKPARPVRIKQGKKPKEKKVLT